MIPWAELADSLIRTIEESLPREIDAAHSKKWDAVLINRYLYQRREAKKLGRKERKHKEAQAVLAAATAAAASSSRTSSFRKDPLNESANHEVIYVSSFDWIPLMSLLSVVVFIFIIVFNLLLSFLQVLLNINITNGRGGPPASETFSREGTQRDSSERHLDFGKEYAKLCDICSRPEKILNPILVCSSCKVIQMTSVFQIL